MQKLMKYISIFSFLGLISTSWISCTKDSDITDATEMGPGSNNNWENSCACLNEIYPVQNLNQTEIEALLFMREEEKLARDVYAHFYKTWDHHVFDNITNSEDQHISLVSCLMEKYDLEEQEAYLKEGVFLNDHLRELYENLISIGEKSLVDAFYVGATIEDVDIYDLENYDIPEIDNADIQAVFAELTKGSRNHMRAFTKNLTNLGTTYEAQYIDKDQLDSIINSSKETNEIICTGN